MRDRFAGRVAIVTGASRGVGAATAVALAQRGCAVVCAGRSTTAEPQRLAGTIDETAARVETTGAQALAVPTNLANEAEIVHLVSATVERFGRLDYVVNNAAITFIGDLTIPTKRFDLIMSVNTRAPFLLTREAVPHLRAAGGGAVLNISSAASLIPIPHMSIYGMSKIALEHATLDAARELAPDQIAVNCLRIDLPVATEGYMANAPDADHDTWEPPEVAAEGIVWMLSQPPSYTGRRESMALLGRREGIMRSRARRSVTRAEPTTQMFEGLWSAPPHTRVVDG